jgi:hypothetical protein
MVNTFAILEVITGLNFMGVLIFSLSAQYMKVPVSKL